MLATKPDDMNLISRSSVVERENQFPHIVLSRLCAHYVCTPYTERCNLYSFTGSQAHNCLLSVAASLSEPQASLSLHSHPKVACYCFAVFLMLFGSPATVILRKYLSHSSPLLKGHGYSCFPSTALSVHHFSHSCLSPLLLMKTLPWLQHSTPGSSQTFSPCFSTRIS